MRNYDPTFRCYTRITYEYKMELERNRKRKKKEKKEEGANEKHEDGWEREKIAQKDGIIGWKKKSKKIS